MAFLRGLVEVGLNNLADLIQGVPFLIVLFENATVTKLFDIMTCKYDFYKAKRWTF